NCTDEVRDFPQGYNLALLLRSALGTLDVKFDDQVFGQKRLVRVRRLYREGEDPLASAVKVSQASVRVALIAQFNYQIFDGGPAVIGKFRELPCPKLSPQNADLGCSALQRTRLQRLQARLFRSPTRLFCFDKFIKQR